MADINVSVIDYISVLDSVRFLTTGSFHLSDGKTSINLNDKIKYKVLTDTLLIEPGEVTETKRPKHKRGKKDRTRRTHRRYYKEESPALSMELEIIGTSYDDLIDNQNAVEAMLRKARDYYEEQTTDKVTLELKLFGSTTPTYYQVLNGLLEPGNKLFGVTTVREYKYPRAKLTLEVYQMPFIATRTLKNYVQSDRLTRDADSDGVANNWTSSTGAGITATYSVTDAQRIAITAATGAGNATVLQEITLANVYNLAVGDVVSCRADAKMSTATNFQTYFSLDYYNGAVYISSSSNADLSTVSNNFTTIKTQGSTIPANTTIIRISLRARATAAGGIGTAWFKNVMLEKASTCSDEYISSCRIVNHLDSGAGHYNYIDIEGVKGQARGPATIRVSTASQNFRTLWIAQRARPTLSEFTWVLDSADSETDIAYTTTTSDATAVGGSYRAKTHADTATYAAGSWNLDDYWESCRGDFRVFALVYHTAAGATNYSYQARTEYKVGIFYYSITTGKWVATKQASAWHILDLGTITLPTQATPLGTDISGNYVSVYGKRTGGASSDGRLDAVWLLPVGDPDTSSYLQLFADLTAGATTGVTIDGIADPPTPYIGLLNQWPWTYSYPLDGTADIMLEPGDNRLYILKLDDGSNSMTIASAMEVTVEYVPMGETLL